MKDNILDRWLQNELYPELWNKLPQIFPEFGFISKNSHFQATNKNTTKLLPGQPRPDRVCVYPKSAFGFQIHGESFITWISYLNSFQKPLGQDYIIVIKELSKRAGVPLPENGTYKNQKHSIQINKEERKNKLLECFTEYTHNVLLSEKGKKGLEYLISRGLNPDYIKKSEFGFYTDTVDIQNFLLSQNFTSDEIGWEYQKVSKEGAPVGSGVIYDTRWNNRIIGIWRDQQKKISNIWSRDINNQSKINDKYLMLKGGKKDCPYGLEEQAEEFIIVEGFMDAELVKSYGIKNIVATGGAKPTKKQIDILSSYNPSILFLGLDNDNAGEKGTLETINLLHDNQKSGFVLSIPGHYKDIAEWIQKEGILPFKNTLYKSRSSVEWILEKITAKYSIENKVTKQKALNKIMESITKVRDSLLKHEFIELTAAKFNLPVEELKKRLQGEVSEKCKTTQYLSKVSTPALHSISPVKTNEEFPPLAEDIIEKFYEEEEFGDAKLLKHLYNKRVIFDHSEKKWYIWGGNAWLPDTTFILKQIIASQIASQYIQLSANIVRKGEGNKKSIEKAEQTFKRAKKLRTVGRVKNILSFASSLMGITGQQWDSNPWLLGVKNGVINLKTGTFREGTPHDYIRKIAPTEWKGLHQSAPQWEKFLAEIMGDDLEKVQFLKRLLGYAITGLSTEHILPIFWGCGRNGKDTLLEVLGSILGETARPISTQVVMASDKHSGAEPHVYDLWGKRLVWASETNEGKKFNSAKIKSITGGGTIKTRPLYGNMVEFKPTHLLILITNFKPHAPSYDYALWERLILIPFTQSFVDNPVKPHERKKIKDLHKILIKESSCILAWLVQGCLEWQQKGLCPPQSIRNATTTYRQEEDPINDFLALYCEQGNYRIKATDLYDKYKKWTEKNKKLALAQNKFGNLISEIYQKKHFKDGNYYIGIKCNFKGEGSLSN